MSERPLLLSGARSAVLVPAPPSLWWQRAALIVGALVVFVGFADLMLRASHFVEARTPGEALAPLGTLQLPQVAARAQTPEPFVPTRLRIGSIGVDAPVESVALKADNKTMASPKKFTDIAWYSPGPKPGQEGNAVFAGHLNSPVLGLDGAFSGLKDIELGDTVVAEGAAGESRTYLVRRKENFVTAAAPTEEIFRHDGPSQLVLVTCEGDWDPNSRTFDKRLVVTAQLLPL